MKPTRLRILYVSQIAPSPATYGAQRRIQGLMKALARDHELHAVTLLSHELDRGEAERSMREFCREVVLIPAPRWEGRTRRAAQLRSLASRQSFERRIFDHRVLQRSVRELLGTYPFDVVNVEFPFLAHLRLDHAPAGSARPLQVLDEHNIESDLARQQAGADQGFLRRFHNAVNWPKLQREEMDAFGRFDGVTFCSEADEQRARNLVPSVRSAVVPNAVDIDEFRPSTDLSAPDGQTIMFFGAINYFPNVDGLLYLLHEIWPLIEQSHPRAKLKIVGQHPTREILAFRGPRIEVTGKVDDLRPHLASAAVTVVPLRLGGGTRFKILEAMAMARPVVSTSLGAEGIGARPGKEILIADDPASFAQAVGRVLDDGALAAELSGRGRALVQERYSWEASAQRLESFLHQLLESRRGHASAA
jgi:glycosyltransferase involved in cell wall biosynthesis